MVLPVEAVPKISKVAIIVGESSGDIIGSALIRQFKKTYSDVYCYGVGGPLMIAEGFDSLFSLERFSVMGLVEVLARIWDLVKIRRYLRKRFLRDKPDVFIGIDYSEFNLSLAVSLKKVGIPIIQYVSPKIWAWRSGRIKKIKKIVDHMLVLLPFEEEYYRRYSMAATFVGHPLADQIPLIPADINAEKKKLFATGGMFNIALLPGSRKSEIHYLSDVLLQTAVLLQKRYGDVRFLIPCVNHRRKEQVKKFLLHYPDLPVTLYDGKSRSVINASDVVLMASGTASLEAALCKRPSIVCYKMNRITYAIAKRLVKVKYISLPNLLADKLLIPEFIQEYATAEILYDAVVKILSDQKYKKTLIDEFIKIHHCLKKDASQLALRAIQSTVKRLSDAKGV